MKKTLYKTLLEMLKWLVSLKRGVTIVFFYIQKGFFKLDELVRNTIGYRLYAWQKRIQKSFRFLNRFRDGRVVELFGERKTLQLLFFIVLLGVFVPHSRLYTKSDVAVPGRATLLYQVVGPGPQDFDLQQEILVTEAAPIIYDTEEYSWNNGIAMRDIDGSTGAAVTSGQGDRIASIGVGGSVLVKPTIQGGALPPSSVEDGASRAPARRTEATTYIVQEGDVLGTIASDFGVSLETILWENNLTSRSVLQPGDTLTILPVSGVSHTIKSGDTLGKIARLYDAEIGDILDANGMDVDTPIQLGAELIIPGGKRIQQAPIAVAYTAPAASVSSQYTVINDTPKTTTVAPDSSGAPASSGYLWPTNVFTITQYYGWQHTGLDIAGPVGSYLYATRAGTVIKSQCGWNGGYGCYVILDHGDGVQSVYAHASELLVSAGESVAQGQTVALMGSTGRSTGPHIHFEIRVNGQRLNPLNYIR